MNFDFIDVMSGALGEVAKKVIAFFTAFLMGLLLFWMATFITWCIVSVLPFVAAKGFQFPYDGVHIFFSLGLFLIYFLILVFSDFSLVTLWLVHTILFSLLCVAFSVNTPVVYGIMIVVWLLLVAMLCTMIWFVRAYQKNQRAAELALLRNENMIRRMENNIPYDETFHDEIFHEGSS